jgi:hypothetical protein
MTAARKLFAVGVLGLLASCEAPQVDDDDGSLGREGGLVVSSVTGPSVVIRLEDGRSLAELDLGSSARLAASRDGAVVFALSEQGAVIVDGGMRWSVHGNHYHVRAGRPRLLPHRIEVPGARGVVSARGRFVLISPDAGEGRAQAVQLFEDDLPNDEVRLDRFDLGANRTLVAAPVAGSVVASAALVDGAGLAVYERPTLAGVRIEATCSSARAASSFHEAGLFACDEGLVRVSKDGAAWKAESIAWTAEGPADTLEPHVALPMAAGRTATGVLRYDDAGRRSTHASLGERPVRVGLDRGDSSRIVALLADGAIRVVSPDGMASSRFYVEARSDEAAPFAVGLRHAYVSRNDGDEVLEVALDDGRVTRRFPAPGGVAGLALMGHKWFNVPDVTADH